MKLWYDTDFTRFKAVDRRWKTITSVCTVGKQTPKRHISTRQVNPHRRNLMLTTTTTIPILKQASLGFTMDMQVLWVEPSVGRIMRGDCTRAIVG